MVATSDEILGQPFSNAIYYTTTKFHDGNPIVAKAFFAAARRAADLIAADPRAACEAYIAATGEKLTVDALVQQLGNVRQTFSMAPFGMGLAAAHMADVKMLRTRPGRWQEMFFPEAADLPGN